MTGIEIATVATFLGALKNLKDLTASLSDTVPQQVRDQVLDLADRFSDVQVGLLESHQREAELVDRCRALKEELDRAKDWETQRARYLLKTLNSGAAVYVQKPDVEVPEDPHWLCANCFENREKSIVQPQRGILQQGQQEWKCPRCRATFGVPWGAAPSKEA